MSKKFGGGGDVVLRMKVPLEVFHNFEGCCVGSSQNKNYKFPTPNSHRLPHPKNNSPINQTYTYKPSQDSSVGSISAWYWGGPGFKSWQGQEFFNENK